MKKVKKYWLTLFVMISLFDVGVGVAQQKVIIPDLSKVTDKSVWGVYNRSVSFSKGVRLDSRKGEGVLWLIDSEFTNGSIELDLKGENKPGKSFVGVAFRGVNDSTYDAVYFRPFNFANPQRSSHSIQYISHPKYPWYKLRKQFPGKYEGKVTSVPNPDQWFHARIEIEKYVVKVFVNHDTVPSLEVEMLNPQQKGWIGFWVGYNSDGMFKHLKIRNQ